MKRRYWIGGGCLCLLLLLALGMPGLKRERQEPVIGIMVWKDGSELSRTEIEYVEQMDEYLDADLRVMEISGERDPVDQIEAFGRSGGDVLINVDSQDFPEILRTCEKYQVYLLQMWEMTMDTDILEKAMEHEYFLGCLLSDDMSAGEAMTEALRKAGCREISILTYHWGDNLSNAQQRRNLSFQKALEPEGPADNLEIYSFDEGLRYLAGQNEKLDGLLLSERIMEYSVQTAKEIMGNDDLKFAYFDVNDFTREDLKEGSVAMAVCGQQNVVQLAVACACGFVEGGKSWQEKLSIPCSYLYITSAEEYDRYRRLCVEEAAYSEEMMVKLIDSLRDNRDLLVEYAQSYSLEWLEKQKNS